MAKLNFQQPLLMILQHILVHWFGAQEIFLIIINVDNRCCLILLWKPWFKKTGFFDDMKVKKKKKQHLFETKIFCNIINIFTSLLINWFCPCLINFFFLFNFFYYFLKSLLNPNVLVAVYIAYIHFITLHFIILQYFNNITQKMINMSW